jgi:hypothetical protein
LQAAAKVQSYCYVVVEVCAADGDEAQQGLDFQQLVFSHLNFKAASIARQERGLSCNLS